MDNAVYSNKYFFYLIVSTFCYWFILSLYHINDFQMKMQLTLVPLNEMNQNDEYNIEMKV